MKAVSPTAAVMLQQQLSGVINFASCFGKVTNASSKCLAFYFIKNVITILPLKWKFFQCWKGSPLKMLLSFDHKVV